MFNKPKKQTENQLSNCLTKQTNKKMKRFKIEYGPQPKLDKWGHYAKVQPPTYNEFFKTLDDAISKASEISKEHKKWCVNVLDIDCVYEDEEHTTMLVVGYDKGVAWYNENYVM